MGDKTQQQTKEYKPGIYPKMTDEEYFSIPAASKSVLNAMRTSPAHALYAMRGDRVPSEAMKFGTAMEDNIQRPAEFDVKYKVSMPCVADMKSGQRKGQKCGADGKSVTDKGRWYCTKHTPDDAEYPDNVIGQESWEKIKKMRADLMASETASELLEGKKGFDQPVILWKDTQFNVQCKAKIDRFAPYRGWSTHVDYKTMANMYIPTPDPVATKLRGLNKFLWHMEDFGYGLQAAHYLDGCEQLDRLEGREPIERRFVFVVQGKDIDPALDRHPVFICEYSRAQVEVYRGVRDRMLGLFAECVESGKWPGPDTEGIYPIGWDSNYE